MAGDLLSGAGRGTNGASLGKLHEKSTTGQQLASELQIRRSHGGGAAIDRREQDGYFFHSPMRSGSESSQGEM
jgi:hypothetical protein